MLHADVVGKGDTGIRVWGGSDTAVTPLFINLVQRELACCQVGIDPQLCSK